MQATPTTWSMLIDAGWAGRDGLKVLCGGEAMPRELAANLVGRVGSLWNMFGPTETTIWSTLMPVTADVVGAAGSIPIGRPIANTVCRVVDSAGRETPVGIVGELYIGGAGVAAGYHDRVELTRQRFVDHDGQRMYRTGDLARWRNDGTIEFLGRIDHQVKVRGHRIELGEIESVLRLDPTISDAVVVADGVASRARLVAYLVPVDGATPSTTAELRAHVGAHLPDYMIPSIFVLLDEFPLTLNLKIDRKALPSPDHAELTARAPYVEPGDDVERLVASMFSELLGVDTVGSRDDFFELGGHSLLATNLLARLHRIFGIDLDLRTFFLDPTVQGNAADLRSSGDSPAQVDKIAQIELRLSALSDDEVEAMLASRRDTGTDVGGP